MHDLGETRGGHYRSRLQVFKRTVSSLGALQISPGSSELGRPQAPVRQIWHRQFHKTQKSWLSPSRGPCSVQCCQRRIRWPKGRIYSVAQQVPSPHSSISRGKLVAVGECGGRRNSQKYLRCSYTYSRDLAKPCRGAAGGNPKVRFADLCQRIS